MNLFASFWNSGFLVLTKIIYITELVPQIFDHRRSTTGLIFFLHFHPFGDPYDMFMQLFYL